MRERENVVRNTVTIWMSSHITYPSLLCETLTTINHHHPALTHYSMDWQSQKTLYIVVDRVCLSLFAMKVVLFAVCHTILPGTCWVYECVEALEMSQKRSEAQMPVLSL